LHASGVIDLERERAPTTDENDLVLRARELSEPKVDFVPHDFRNHNEAPRFGDAHANPFSVKASGHPQVKVASFRVRDCCHWKRLNPLKRLRIVWKERVA